jgi:hypothetical protein
LGRICNTRPKGALDQNSCYTEEKFGRARATPDVGEKAPKAKVLIFDVHNQICDLVMDIDSNNIIYLAKSNGFLTSIRHPLSSRSNGPISWLQKQSFMDGRDSKTIYLN